MKRIRQLYRTFSRTERRYLRQYLEGFHGSGENKALQLIQLLDKKSDWEQDQFANALYGNPKSKAFIMMKSRLLDRMFDVLLLTQNLHNNSQFKEDQASLERIKLIKKYLQVLMARHRGANLVAGELLDDIAKKSDEMSLPELKLMALLQKRSITFDKSIDPNQFRLDIDHVWRQYQNDIKAADYHETYRLLFGEKSAQSEAQLDYLREATQDLEKRLDGDGYSLRAHYYYLNLLVNLHRQEGDTQQGRVALQELVDMTTTEPSLDVRTRKGIPYLRLAALELADKQFEPAFEAASNALEIFNPERTNYLTASVYYLFACLYTYRLDSLFEQAEKLERTNTSNPDHLQKVREIAAYLCSCAWFLRGDPIKANHCVLELQKIQADKEGWNVGVRIYEIILMLEQRKHDLAASRIENLRKHISRYQINSRENQIYRYLYLLDRNSYRYTQPTDEMRNILATLEGQSPWKAFGHEAINFTCWAHCKTHEIPLHTYYREFLEGFS